MPPTATHVAFLRGINVGGHTARKEQLVRAVTSVGVGDVTTFLASGNVLFRAGDRDGDGGLEDEISAALAGELGFGAMAFVRSARQVTTVLRRTPFDRPLPDSGTLQVGFVRSPLRAASKGAVLELTSDRDRLAVTGTEVYWHTAAGVSDSPLFKGPALGRAVGQDITWRNVTTVRRLADRLAVVAP
jgi:uncharacterized protein (DUF1697 family)